MTTPIPASSSSSNNWMIFQILLRDVFSPSLVPPQNLSVSPMSRPPSSIATIFVFMPTIQTSPSSVHVANYSPSIILTPVPTCAAWPPLHAMMAQFNVLPLFVTAMGSMLSPRSASLTRLAFAQTLPHWFFPFPSCNFLAMLPLSTPSTTPTSTPPLTVS